MWHSILWWICEWDNETDIEITSFSFLSFVGWWKIETFLLVFALHWGVYTHIYIIIIKICLCKHEPFFYCHCCCFRSCYCLMLVRNIYKSGMREERKSLLGEKTYTINEQKLSSNFTGVCSFPSTQITHFRKNKFI